MKKVLVSMIAVAMFSFTACSGGKKQEATQEAAPAAAQEVQAAPPATSGSKIDDYKKLMEEATPLLSKIANGDLAAATKYNEIVQKMTTITNEVYAELQSDPVKLKEFTDLAQKWTEEAQKAMTKK
ncbi:MAG: hypothetical protein LBE56_13650 [Tannerella sp.]|jgi:hypothetical protein|nr:hypothetical protein [Tannerella sp.]